MGRSLSVALLPVVLIAGAAVMDLASSGSGPVLHFIAFIGSAPIALLLTLAVAIRAFGPRIGRSLEGVSASCGSAAQAMAMILLVIGAGGAFKQVLVGGGISDHIKNTPAGWSLSPIILAWLIAAVLRVALGSATVAVVIASDVALPLLAGSGVHPEIMVLAISCGSIAFSHVKARTTYTTALSVLGLGGVLAMESILEALSV